MTTKPGPWDQTGETQVEYCRRVVREHELAVTAEKKTRAPSYRFEMREEGTKLLLTRGEAGGRPSPGTKPLWAITGHGQYRITRITEVPGAPNVVWVERAEPPNSAPKPEDDGKQGPEI